MALFLCAGVACSIIVDTGNLDTQTDATEGGVDGALLNDAGEASVSPDASGGEGGSMEGGCPSRGGPMIAVPVGDGGYCIDSTEVTRGAYQEFLSAAPDVGKQIPECAWNTTFLPGGSLQGNDLPVTYVNWCDAYAFCAWAGKRLCGRIGGGPLPLDQGTSTALSQWYRACSKNATLNYPYGNSFMDQACNVASDGGGGIAPVKSYPKCVGGYDGLFDMVGNVEEWQDSCGGDGGATEYCRDQAGTYGYPADRTAARCDLLDTDQRNYQGPDVGIRCCAP